MLQLTGGNDCLNTFIPYTDQKYRDARPTLAISDASILKVTDRIGFHPSMERLKDLYLSGKLAFINNVGFASLDRSHFRCRDIWQTGIETSGSSQGARGWLGRYADLYLANGSTAVTTFSVGPRAPLGLTASELSGTAITDPDGFDSSTNLVIDPTDSDDQSAYKQALFQAYGLQRPASDVELIRDRGNAAFQAVELFKQVSSSSTTPYPDSYLGKTFKLIARIVAANIGTDIVWVSVDGFDTHGLQANTHSALLTDVSNSLWAFQDDLTGRGLSDDVIVLAWSEFGRRVAENGNKGTDHGKAGTVFLVGDHVKGGTHYGDEPNLSDLDDGDLKTRIDFRSIYSTVIQDWFGRDPFPVLQSNYENLGFIERPPKRRAARH
ncbi:MAG TPA: DUF1501 domain-containing protein [Thermoanaerobaculia bacterium]|nr:DUF1501 domain-containing protein [Thermoanaerobaculia bacterium]